jgi:hypothetical protein
VNQLSTTTNPTKTITKSISQQANRVKFQSFKTKELKRKKKKKPRSARLHHLQAETHGSTTSRSRPTPPGRDRHAVNHHHAGREKEEIGKPKPRSASPSHRINHHAINHHHAEIGKPKPPNHHHAVNHHHAGKPKPLNHHHAVLQQKTQKELFSTERRQSTERRKEKRRRERKSRMKMRGKKKKNRGYILGGEMFFLIRYKTDTKCTVAFHL